MLEAAFLADMNIISPDCLSVKRAWLEYYPFDKSAKDLDLLEYAREHEMIIITQDLDFSMLLALKGYEKPSLINVRLEEAKPDDVTNRIVDSVVELGPELTKGIVITVDEISVRYRYLPIKT